MSEPEFPLQKMQCLTCGATPVVLHVVTATDEHGVLYEEFYCRYHIPEEHDAS